MKKVIGIMFGIFLLTAGAFAQANLGGARWQLIEINGKRVANSRIYIEFDNGQSRLSGHSGCNRFSGGYQLRNEVFTVGGIASTKMACMRPGLMVTEQQFLRALSDSTRLRRTGVNLSMFRGRTRVLRFRSTVRPDDDNASELTARKWMLKSVGGRPVTLTKNAPFLTFDAEKNQAGGNGSCNGFGGSYEVNGSAIKFGNMISTMMACEYERRMAIERGFLDGLQKANRFEVRRNRLVLSRGSQMLLEFEGTAK